MTLPPLSGLDHWLAGREGSTTNLRAGAGKRIDWADGSGRQTTVSVVFVHGFSASPRELSPYPERVAKGLGANFHAARLTGHGQDGAAMARATLADWCADVAEALAVGRAIGERTLVMGCSTGATLLALALAGGENVAAAVMLAPLFGTRSRRVQLALDLPLPHLWIPRLMPGERGQEMTGERGLVWTGRYPPAAFIPMAQAVRAVRRADLDAIRGPAFFAFADGDAVVDARLTRAAIARWGGPVTVHDMQHGPGDDPMRHVPAGLLSPGLTDGLTEATLDWTRSVLS